MSIFSIGHEEWHQATLLFNKLWCRILRHQVIPSALFLHLTHCAVKICLDLYSYFCLFWEMSRHNKVQWWNNNADSIECRHRQAKTQTGKWAPDSINNHHSWDMLLIQWDGSLCSAFLTEARVNSGHFSSGQIKDSVECRPVRLLKYWLEKTKATKFGLDIGESFPRLFVYEMDHQTLVPPWKADTKHSVWIVTIPITLNIEHDDLIHSMESHTVSGWNTRHIIACSPGETHFQTWTKKQCCRSLYLS